MKKILSLIISGALVVSGYTQTRNVLVGTNNAVVQPTNFWSADASNARTGLGLGSAATNPASAFQPSSATLSNLSLGNGSGLTNVTASAVSSALSISNTAGLQSALDGKLSTNGSATSLTNFPSNVLQTNSSLSLFPDGLLKTNGNAIGLTNFPVIPVTSGGTGGTNEATARGGIGLGTTNTLTIAGLVSQNLTITAGGGITLQSVLTNAGPFRTNIGLPWSGLTNADATAFRTALGLGTAATSAATIFQPSSSVLTNLAANNGSSLTNLQASNLVGTIDASNVPVVTLTNIGGTLAVSKGGTGATNASEARQNLGATTVGNSVFVATNAEAARTAINALAPNGNATSLTNFPALLLRTNGDGSGITNISGASIVGAVANASNITGTIAISNVSNLQSSLDSKLSTNPTLAIANISNLQTALDGKLSTNPTLQISNIAALQTALDGKLSGSFPIAISNVSGLQTSLDGKLSTNPTLAIANISGLQTNLDSKLSITGNAVNLTNFPTSLLRATGDASGLTNFPTLNQNTTGTASNVTGVVEITNGGTGTNSATGARQNLGLSWSGLTNTNAETFRTALGLGSLSTLSSVAISNVTGLQTALDAKLASNGNAINLTNFPTSLLRVDGSAIALTNFPSLLLRTNGDAGALTNFPTFNQNTTGTASNVTGVVAIANGGTGATNAANARTALGLNTAATNPATAFQQSSTILSNLASSNGGGLTNIAASSVIGTVATASNITGTAALASNVTGVVALSNGGTGATNASGARTALGIGSSDVFVGLTNLGSGSNLGFSSSAYILGSTNSTTPNNAVLALDSSGVRSVAGLTLPALTNTTVSDFRTAIGLSSAATNPSSAFQPSSAVLTNLANSNAVNLTNLSASNIVGVISISNGGIGASTVGSARTNLGLGWSALTNSNSATQLLGYTTNGLVVANTTNPIHFTNEIIKFNIGNLSITNGKFYWTTNSVWSPESNSFATAINFDNTNAASETRVNLGFSTNLNSLWNTTSVSGVRSVLELSASWLTNTNITNFRTEIGLGWSALTNSNAGTSLVSVNTNGEVVSPTNFWQASPANTRVQVSQPVVNATNSATNARNLYFYSLAISTTGVTNTVQLPNNSATLLGDVVTVIHEGPTNSVTAVRSTGAGTNLITLNQFQEAVKFIYESAGWRLADNISYVEPIYFSGTNASSNAAASRVNLGFSTNLNTLWTATSQSNARDAIALGDGFEPTFQSLTLVEDTNSFVLSSIAGINRTNLGLGSTNNVTFNNVTASGTLTATSTVTAKTNLVVEGYLDFTTNATNNNPLTNNQINDFIEIRVGTNQFWIPVYK